MNNDTLDWDCEQFEADMEKEVSHRKMLGSLSMDKRFSEIRISDQFFIFGVPPNSKKQEPYSILAAFPPNQLPHIPINNILCLSNPNSEYVSTNSKKLANIFPLIDISSSPSSDSGIVDEYVFQYNAGPTKMYGICVQVQPSKAIKQAINPFYSSDNTKKAKFCFCLISKIPIFNAHFTFLHYLIGLSNGLITPDNSNKRRAVSITDPSTNATNQHPLIESLEINCHFGQLTPVEVPDEFQSMITDHFSKTLFSSAVKLSPSHIIHFPPPTTAITKLVLYASVDTLFSILTINDIIEIITALILDAQVLVIGTCMQEVSMTVYGLYSLLTPFKYCGVVMPILPNNEDYLNLLNSPTPYIYGLANIAKLRKMTFLESTYIVNLDKRKMTNSNFFPKYPNAKEVAQKVNDLLNESRMKKKTRNDKVPTDHRDKCKSMMVESKQQIKSKPTFSPKSKKVPPIVDEKELQETKKDEQASIQKAQPQTRRRHYTVNKKEPDEEHPMSKDLDQLSEFPVFEKKPNIPELANDDNPYKFPPEFTKKLNHKVSLSMESIDKIINALHEPMEFIFTDTLNGYFVTNATENITIFNQALFIASVKQEDLSFYEFLLESQTFQDYVETKLHEFTVSKNVDPNQRRRSSFGSKGRKRAATVRRVIKAID